MSKEEIITRGDLKAYRLKLSKKIRLIKKDLGRKKGGGVKPPPDLTKP